MTGQSFWERRKAAVQAEEVAEQEACAVAQAEARAKELEAMEDEAALSELGLPDPSSLGPGDDFSVFMRAGVPDKFRRIALRRLWRSNPVLACVDGLNDYDEDYRTQALGQVVKTAYQVGKGMLAHVEALERKSDAVAEEAAVPVAAPVESLPATDSPDRSSDIAADPAPAECTAAEEEQAVDEAMASARRMRFNFEENTA